ncbi:rhodanese-like domain-containing protein [Thermus thermamylovorans]|uniref:Rhodanese-like domain-containing protein n=1 Tax=Thermus thermamylovorans TaxID=2509362 RepID=A0A4Q9B359_9DEIN|nr:rhodanese-like domain-containing protein [Thermus thermamylovorans]TBH20091.1 rhodanese-like domain-containing protein [Thermus thermamylovorans]
MARLALLALLTLGLLAACGPKGGYRDVGPEELYRAVGSEALIVDVRTPQEFFAGHVPGAVNYPLEGIATWADRLPKDRPVYVYCRSGNRSRQAVEYLARRGYTNLYHVQGGVLAIEGVGYPLVR